MILLIPTNDNISIAADFARAFSFRYMFINNGYVKDDDLRRIEAHNLEDFLNSLQSSSDSSAPAGNESKTAGAILVSGLSVEYERFFRNHHFEIIYTKEHFIFNAVLDYIKRSAYRESNYCCAP
jgi:hypothetical protein